jgi:hypothetical protein
MTKEARNEAAVNHPKAVPDNDHSHLPSAAARSRIVIAIWL